MAMKDFRGEKREITLVRDSTYQVFNYSFIWKGRLKSTAAKDKAFLYSFLFIWL